MSSGEDQLKFVCLRRGICNPRRCDNVGISTSIVLIRGDRGWLMHILIFLIYLVSGKTHFDNYYYHVNADFYRVNKPVRQTFLNM